MADRRSTVKIGVEIDKKSAAESSAALRAFFRSSAKDQGDLAKENARLQTALTRELTKQDELRARSSIRTNKQQEDAQRTSLGRQKKELENKAKYEYQTGQKSKDDYIHFLKQQEDAERQSYGRRVTLLKQRQKLEAPPKPNIAALLGSGAVNAASALGSVAAIQQTIGFANSLADAASSSTETLNKLSAVFKGNSQDVIDWSQNSAKAFGLSRQEAQEAAATFGNFFIAAGVVGKESVKMSTSLVGLSADISSFNNVTDGANTVLENLRSGLVGEAEPLRKYGIFLSEARVQAEALSVAHGKTAKDSEKVKQAHDAVAIAAAKAAVATKKYGEGSIESAQANLALDKANGRLKEALKGSTKELTEGEKIAARYRLILRDSKTQQGDFAKTSTEAANAQRILNAQIKDAEAALGQKLLPLKKEVIGFLSGMLDKFNALSPATQDFITNIGGISLIVIPAIAALGNLAISLYNIAKAYKEIRTAQEGTTLAGGIGAGLRTFGTSVAGVAAGVAPIALPLLAAGGIAYAGATGSIGDSERNISALEQHGSERIAALQAQIATLRQQRGASRTPAGTDRTRNPYYQGYQRRIDDAENELRLLRNQSAIVANTSVGKIQITPTGGVKVLPHPPGNIGAPGSDNGSPALYSGAEANAAAAKATAAQNKALAKQKRDQAEQQRQAALLTSLEAETEKKAAEIVTKSRDTAFRLTAAVLSVLPTEQDIARIATNTEEKVAMEKRIHDTAARLHEISLDFLKADKDVANKAYAKQSLRQKGDSDAIAAQRVKLAEQTRKGAISDAYGDYYKREQDVNRDAQEARKRLTEGWTKEAEASGERNQKTIDSQRDYLAAEAKVIEANLKRAELIGDVNGQEQLIKAQMKNKTDQAAGDFYLGVLSGNLPQATEALAALKDASNDATEALRRVAEQRRANVPEIDLTNRPQYEQPSTGYGAMAYQYAGHRPGFERFQEGYDRQGRRRIYDTTRQDSTGTGQKEVNGTQLQIIRSLNESAQANSAEFLRNLFSGGDARKNALSNLGKNLGQDVGSIAAQALHKSLIESPIRRFFEDIAGHMGEKISLGGKGAGNSIAAAASYLASISLLSGQQGKKKQRGGFLGAALGLIAGSLIPGGNLLTEAAIGATVGGSFLGFAGGGRPPFDGRSVLVGEYGPELVRFGGAAEVVPAGETRAALSGRGAGGSGGYYRGDTHVYIEKVENRADVDRVRQAIDDKNEREAGLNY